MFEFFVQDEFHWKPNLTVSYGIRYTLYGQPFDSNHQNTSFLPSAYSAANAPTLVTDGTSFFICTPETASSLPDCSGATPNPSFNPLNGLIVSTGNKGAVGLGATPSPWGAAVTHQNNLNFGPRIGISWDPTKQGKMAVRTGYGLFFDSPAIGYVENNLFNNPPFVTNINIANTVFHDPGSVAPTPNSSPISLRGVAENWKLPYTQAWSFDVQTQLPKTLILDIGYYGNMGTHLLGLVDNNQPLPGAAVAAGLGDPANGGINQNNYQVVDLVRPYRGYGPIELASTVFTSNYHSLQIGVQKQFGSGSQVGLNYTWSHALTTAGNDFSSPQNSRDLKAEYGPADFDRRQIFTADYVYQFPFYKDQQGVIGHLAGGWEVSGIVTLNSGLWLTPLGNAFGVDPAGLGLFNPGVAGDGLTGSPPFRPDQVSNPNSGAPHTVDQWFNTVAFVSPSGPGVPGNARRGSILGPGIARWDMSLFKNIRIGERISMQFRAEGFNILNHTNFDGVDTNVSSGTYGQVVSAHEPRIVQLGLKLNF